MKAVSLCVSCSGHFIIFALYSRREELLSAGDPIFIYQQNMTRSALYSSASETWSLKDQEVPLFTHPPWKRISGDFSEENPLRKSPTLRLGASAFWVWGMTKQRPHRRRDILLARWTDLWRWRKGSLSTRRFFWDSPRESPKKINAEIRTCQSQYWIRETSSTKRSSWQAERVLCNQWSGRTSSLSALPWHHTWHYDGRKTKSNIALI